MKSPADNFETLQKHVVTTVTHTVMNHGNLQNVFHTLDNINTTTIGKEPTHKKQPRRQN